MPRRKTLKEETSAYNIVLDVVGLIPGIGEFADLANSLDYARKGDYLFSALSLVSIIPELGDLVGKGGKVAIALSKLGKSGKAISKAGQAAAKNKKFTDTSDYIVKLKKVLTANQDLIDSVFEKAAEIDNKELQEHLPRIKEAVDLFIREAEEVEAAVDEAVLRECVRELLNEGVEFRTLDSPLTYSRASNVKRIAYCDVTVTSPPDGRDAYFKEWEKWRRRTKSGRKKLKKPVLEEIIPGVSDVCIIGFLDYHSQGESSDGNVMWYIDYMKTRGDSQGSGVASKLMDQFYETVAQPGDNVNFGKMMRKEIGYLKDKMKDRYPEVNTIGSVYF